MDRVCAMGNWKTGCPNVETMTTGRYIVPNYDESLKQSPPGQEIKKVVSAFVSVCWHSIQGRQAMLRGRADPNIQLHCSPSARLPVGSGSLGRVHPSFTALKQHILLTCKL